MRKTFFAITLGLVIGLLAGPVQQAFGQGPPSIAAHHQDRSFTVAPGASQSFELPRLQVPVRIDVSFSILNGATQTPSEIMYAVVNQDQVSYQFTWVGTNSDATMQAGTSIPTGSGPVIATICGGAGCPVTNATLEVDNPFANIGTAAPGTLKLTVNADTVAAPATFKVSMWY